MSKIDIQKTSNAVIADFLIHFFVFRLNFENFESYLERNTQIKNFHAISEIISSQFTVFHAHLICHK